MVCVSINTMKTSFLFKFFNSLNFMFTSKHREAVNWKFLFVLCMFMCIQYAVWNQKVKTEVVLIVLIYTTTCITEVDGRGFLKVRRVCTQSHVRLDDSVFIFIFKETENYINYWFTTVPLKAMSDQVWIRYASFFYLSCLFSAKVTLAFLD